MTWEEFVAAMESIGFSPTVARAPIPEIAEGDSAKSNGYHLVHLPDGRVAVEVPEERGNNTARIDWLNGPAIFATVEEARAVVFLMLKRDKELYSGG